jgi:hypothetical protein
VSRKAEVAVLVVGLESVQLDTLPLDGNVVGFHHPIMFAVGGDVATVPEALAIKARSLIVNGWAAHLTANNKNAIHFIAERS